MSTLVQWSGDGLSGNLTTGSAGPGDTAPSFITGAVPTIEPFGERPPAIRFAQDGIVVNYAVWVFSAVDLFAYTIRAYANFSAFAASDQTALWKVVNAAETLAAWAVAVTSTGLLRIMDKNGATAATGDVALVPGTWYRIEGVVNGDSCKVYAFEGESTTEHDSVTATLPSPVAGGRVRVGNDFGTPHAPPFWFDDLKISNEPALIGIASPPRYIDLATLKDALTVTSSVTDSALTKVIAAAERTIDEKTRGVKPGGAFTLDATATARTYRTTRRTLCEDDGELLFVDDIGASTGLVVEVGDGTTWTTVPASDYDTEPENALATSQAITLLRRVTGYWSGNRLVRVTARWGWPAIPDDIAEATLLQAVRLASRPSNPEGVAGSSDWGLIRMPNLDPDVKALIAPYKKPGVA